MATNAYGMLGLGAADALDQQSINARRERAMNYARLTPAQQSSYNASNAAQMVGQGVGEIAGAGVGMLTGQDTRNTAQKARGVQQQITEALKGVDPSDIDTAYPVIIRILRDNGMIPEAMAAAEKYESLKAGKAEGVRKNEETTTRRMEVERKERADLAKDAVARLKIEAGDSQSQLGKSINGLGALYAKRDALPENDPRREGIQRQIGMMEASIAKVTRRNTSVIDGGTVMRLVDNDTAEIIREFPKALSPKDAEKETSKTAAKERLTGSLRELSVVYEDLNAIGAMVNAGGSTVSNVIARVRSSGAGQLAEGGLGTKAQALRDRIAALRPLLINDIRQASDMSARGLDSEKELEFYLNAATDPTKEIKSNIEAINTLSRIYGTGVHITIDLNKRVQSDRRTPVQTPGAGQPAQGGASKANPAAPRSRAEFDALPAGTWVKTPDGNVGQK